MFGDLELQNSLKYYIQEKLAIEGKDTLTYNKKEFHDEIGKDCFSITSWDFFAFSLIMRTVKGEM